MAYLIAREEPVKIKDIELRYLHNERMKNNKSEYGNKNIRLELSKNNYYFKKPEGSYIAEFNKMKEEGLFSTRKVRLNDNETAIASEILIAVNGKFFERFEDPAAEMIEFFSIMNRALNNFFSVELPNGEKLKGEDLVISSVIHIDELSPEDNCYNAHLHYVTPTCVARELRKRRTKKEIAEGKEAKSEGHYFQLSHSGFWDATRKEDGTLELSYTRLQDYLHDALIGTKYESIERGQRGSTRKHLSCEAFKALMNETKKEAEKNIAPMIGGKKIAGKYIIDGAAMDNLQQLQKKIALQETIIEKDASIINEEKKQIISERIQLKKKEMQLQSQIKENEELSGKYSDLFEKHMEQEKEKARLEKELSYSKEIISCWEELFQEMFKLINPIKQMIDKALNPKLGKEKQVEENRKIVLSFNVMYDSIRNLFSSSKLNRNMDR